MCFYFLAEYIYKHLSRSHTCYKLDCPLLNKDFDWLGSENRICWWWDRLL